MGEKRKLFLTVEIKLINAAGMRTNEVKKKKKSPFCKQEKTH